MLNVWLLCPHVLGPAPPQLSLSVHGRMDKDPLQVQISPPTTISPPFLHLPTCQVSPLQEKLCVVHVDLHAENNCVICFATVAFVQL